MKSIQMMLYARSCYDNWKSVICWLQYDNGVAEKSPEDFGIARVAE